MFPMLNEETGYVECYELTKQGPCPHGQIVLMENEKLTKAGCVERPCPDEDFILFEVKKNCKLSRRAFFVRLKMHTVHEYTHTFITSFSSLSLEARRLKFRIQTPALYEFGVHFCLVRTLNQQDYN